jgi:hypothetical protein
MLAWEEREGGQVVGRRETRSRGVGESPLVNKTDIEASIESGSGSGEGDVDTLTSMLVLMHRDGGGGGL